MSRPEQIAAIEQDLAAAAVFHFGLDLRCLLFNATNFFTFLDSFNSRAQLPQRGHSKEGRDNLRLLGLALLVTSDGEVPLFHHTYQGNQHDSVTFHSVAEEFLPQRCRCLAEGASDVTLVFDKGNNSKENLAIVDHHPVHFVGSLVPPTPDLLHIPRRAMRRLDRAQLPSVWSHRTRKVVLGVERTILCTWNQELFQAQTRTLAREIAKRKRKLQSLQLTLQRRRKQDKGKKPTVEGVLKRVKEIVQGRHMTDLFAVQVQKPAKAYPVLPSRLLASLPTAALDAVGQDYPVHRPQRLVRRTDRPRLPCPTPRGGRLPAFEESSLPKFPLSFHWTD